MEQEMVCTMPGLWLEHRHLALRRDLPLPEPPPGEALIRTRLAGICATDLELTRGYYPFAGVPGHEFVGTVEAAPGAPHWEGRRVVGEINAVCGTCEVCAAGRPTHCPQRTVLGIVNRHGVLASHFCLPLANLHPVPDGLPDEAAVFCEPLAAALRIRQQVAIEPGQRVLLLGAGRLGQLIARSLQLTGCRLQVVARHPGQRALLEAQGIPVLAPDQVVEGAADLVVEASGSPDGFELARRAVRPAGCVVLKSTHAGGATPLDLSALVVDEVTLVGSRCGPFAPALELLAQGQVDPLPLVAARYPLSRGLEAFEHAARPGTLKVLVEPD
jgi:threonine dehydrogenase-like Zn-dependent dehydrogenase